jgi:hypothetical protein
MLFLLPSLCSLAQVPVGVLTRACFCLCVAFLIVTSIVARIWSPCLVSSHTSLRLFAAEGQESYLVDFSNP